VLGRYCHFCGQENVEVFESTWHIVTHFFNDITHFDGKFFSTQRFLIFKPGFLSDEYRRGRRASYLNPIRMYLFTSAFFFIIFFSTIRINENLSVKTKLKTSEVETSFTLDSLKSQNNAGNNNAALTKEESDRLNNVNKNKEGFSITETKYASRKAYDSVLSSGKKKHNWFQRKLIYREIELNEKYKNDGMKITTTFIDNLVHRFPQILFISLPLFALILQLLYARKKQYFYTNHLIFSVHLYILVFIVLLAVIGLREINYYLHWNAINWLIGLLYVFIFYYEYKALRNFYQQGRGKTILKYFLLNTGHLCVVIVLFLIFTLFSYLKI
jgi:hypothetical protein